MVDYRLAELHPTYRLVVVSTFDTLLGAYPKCPLRRVETYRGDPEDRSMANANVPGVISLNSYWFSDRPLEYLRDQARTGYLYSLPGSEHVSKWHGGMVEPQHVISHELFHMLGDVLPDHLALAYMMWQTATMLPDSAVSGYALAGPEEYWSEACTAAWMLIDHQDARAAREFLDASL